jgi:hypothetical protein
MQRPYKGGSRINSEGFVSDFYVSALCCHTLVQLD